MTCEPFFSFIVPVYNAEVYLSECIQSVRNQTFRDFELLLVDDGSSDSSGAICDEAANNDARIRVIHTENCGASSARATAVDSMTGRYCFPLDSDDFIPANSLERIYSAIKETCPDMVLFGASDDDGNLIPVNMDATDITSDLGPLKYAAAAGHINTLWGKVFSCSLAKKCITKAGERCNYAEDWYEVLSLVDGASTYQVMPDSLYVYRNNQASTMNRYRFGNSASLSRTFSRLEYYANKWESSLMNEARRAEIDNSFLLLKSIGNSDDRDLQDKYFDEFCALISSYSLDKASAFTLKQVFKILCYKLVRERRYKLVALLLKFPF